ncbi:MAG TPA: hypothetical protein VHE30_04080 [Polyangiaceae bacterium]|nr:hypothetical protein [Polyangiaceae bacterium]
MPPTPPHRVVRRVLLVISALGFGGCMSSGDSGCSSRGMGALADACPAPAWSTPHPKSADGRVGVTAAEAWPARTAAGAPSPADVATACAAFAACVNEPSQGRFLLRQACENGALAIPDAPIALRAAERAIPFDGANEDFAFFVRTVVALGGDCAAIRGVLTPRPAFISCQEDGCSGDGDVGQVTCNGDVATITGSDGAVTRDCARAEATCDENSETGCTDRATVACDHPAKDRCDGDVKLGCDHCGLVSFHDCAWNGGHCEETPDGAKCVSPDEAPCFGASPDCDGTVLQRCIGGQVVSVDCAALGMHCEKRSTEVPKLDGGGCGLSPCESPECVTGAPADAG